MRACAECGAKFKPRRSSHRYCSRRCSWSNNGGQNAKSESWRLNAKGYVVGHYTLPNGERVENVKQHRRVMEQYLGRALRADEDVHHKNGKKSDNRIANLEVIPHAEHTREHSVSRPHPKGYRMNLTDAERARRSEFARTTLKPHHFAAVEGK